MLRRMTFVARQASLFLVYGLVGGCYLDLHLFVAPETKCGAGRGKQFRIFRGVRPVARTAAAVGKRAVIDGAACCKLCGLVTLVAELSGGSLDGKGLG